MEAKEIEEIEQHSVSY